MKKLVALLAFALAASVIGCSPTFADLGNRDDDKRFEQMGDFVIFLNTSVLEKYLNYKNSHLHPLAEVKVTYRIRDLKSGKFEEVRDYEDLWFHNMNAVGCRRHEHLQLREGSHGTIYIEDTAAAHDQMRSICNAIARVLLDVHLAQANVTVMAPHHLCDILSADLAGLNFQPVQMLSASQKGILMHVLSEPQGFDKYYFFHVH